MTAVGAAASTFGEWLRQYRLTAGLSQEELAELAGLSARGISDLERGYRRTPQRQTIELLARALGLAAEDAAQWAATVRRARRPAAPGGKRHPTPAPGRRAGGGYPRFQFPYQFP